MSVLARGTASALRATAVLAIAAVLAGLMVKLLYGTAIDHGVLDRVPNAAWDTAYRVLGISQRGGVEDRQDADALLVFLASAAALCIIGCVAYVVVSRRRALQQEHQRPPACEPEVAKDVLCMSESTIPASQQKRRSTFFSSSTATDSEYIFVRDTDLDLWLERREKLEAQWERFRPLCGDGEAAFLADAQHHARERLWEVALACMMLDAGHELLCPPKEAPDILCNFAGQKLWIEATVPDRGTGPDAVDPPHEGMTIIDRDRMMLRYTSALRAKVLQYSEFRKRMNGTTPIVAPGDAYVIAINSSKIPNSDIQGEIPDIVRGVFGLGRQQFSVPVLGAKGPVRSTWPTCISIAKRSGSPVPTTLFLNDDGAPDVSAVLFSPTSPWTLSKADYSQINLVFNPYARVPLPRDKFGFGREWWLDLAASTLCSNR